MAGLPAALLGGDGLANCCLFLIYSVRNTWEQAASQAARPTPRRPVDRPIAAHHCRTLVAGTGLRTHARQLSPASQRFGTDLGCRRSPKVESQLAAATASGSRRPGTISRHLALDDRFRTQSSC